MVITSSHFSTKHVMFGMIPRCFTFSVFQVVSFIPGIPTPFLAVLIIEASPLDILLQPLPPDNVTRRFVPPDNVDTLISGKPCILPYSVSNSELSTPRPHDLSEMAGSGQNIWFIKVVLTDLVIPAR